MTINKNRRDFITRASAFGAAAGVGLASGPALAAKKLKVGVVYVSPVSEIGWTKQHSLGTEAIKKAMGSNVELTIIDNIFKPQDAERVFRQLAASGNQLVFGTSFSHGTPMLKVAPRFPKTAFEHCSGIRHLKNLGTFEAKYYEGTYVAGIAAGRVSKSAKIGFIGGFPIPDIVGPANALILGAQSVNPNIKCSAIFLNSWFDPAKEKEAANTLISQGCDVICSMTDTATGVQVAGQKGAWSIGYASDMSKFAPKTHLTAFTLDWSSIYVNAAKAVAAGTWKAESRWQGLNAGVIKMSPYNSAIPASVQAEMKKAESDIKAGTLHPYKGEIRDQSGKVRVASGSVLPDKDIRGFNWFVKGIIGKLG